MRRLTLSGRETAIDTTPVQLWSRPELPLPILGQHRRNSPMPETRLRIYDDGHGVGLTVSLQREACIASRRGDPLSWSFVALLSVGGWPRRRLVVPKVLRWPTSDSPSASGPRRSDRAPAQRTCISFLAMGETDPPCASVRQSPWCSGHGFNSDLARGLVSGQRGPPRSRPPEPCGALRHGLATLHVRYGSMPRAGGRPRRIGAGLDTAAPEASR